MSKYDELMAQAQAIGAGSKASAAQPVPSGTSSGSSKYNELMAQAQAIGGGNRQSAVNGVPVAGQNTSVDKSLVGYIDPSNGRGSMNIGGARHEALEKNRTLVDNVINRAIVTRNAAAEEWKEAQQRGLKADSSAHGQAVKDDYADKNPLFHVWKEGFERQNAEREAKRQSERASLQKQLNELESSRAYVTTAEQSDELEKQRAGLVQQLEALGGVEEKQSIFKGTGSRTMENLNEEQQRKYNRLLNELDELNAGAGYITSTEQSDTAEAKRKDLLAQIHAIDNEAGRSARSYDSRERAKNFFESWMQGFIGSYANAAGNVTELNKNTGAGADIVRQTMEQELAAATRQRQRAETDLENAKLLATLGDKEAVAKATEKLNNLDNYINYLNNELGKVGQKIAEQTDEQIVNPLYNYADRELAASGAKMDAVKYGKSKAFGFAADMAKTGLDMAADAALNIPVSGAGLASMAARVYGQTAAEARNEGDSAEKAAAKGLTSALIEIATEKLGGTNLSYGEGAISKAFKNAGDKLASSTAWRVVSDTLGEGLEEVVSDVLNTAAEHGFGWDDGTRTLGEALKDESGQMLYDFLLGSAVGALGTGANAMTGAYRRSGGTPAQETVIAESANATAPVQPPSNEAQRDEDWEHTWGKWGTEDWGIDVAENATTTQTTQNAAGAPQGEAQVNTSPAQQNAAQGQIQPTQGNYNAPLQQNIDNGNAEAYNTNNSNAENKTGGMPDVAGSSVEADSGRVPGVYRTGDTEHQGRGGLGEVSERSGLVLLSQQAKDTLAKRGVAVVETQDVSNDKPAFSAALSAARNSDSAHGWAVTPKSIEELEESGARLIMAANGTTGLAVTPDGDIEAVFANKAAGAPKGATKTTIPQAIANGGTKLDCYGKDLVWLYAQYGFVPVARVKFNAEYANPGWDASKGEPDIFFLMHNGDSADTVVEKNGTYEKLTAEELNALPVMEYDEAYKYRDSLLANRQTTNVEVAYPQNVSGNFTETQGVQQTGNGADGTGNVRERGFSQNIRTDAAMEQDIRQSFETSPETYTQLSNKETIAKAQEIFARGLDEAQSTVEQALGAAKAGRKLSPEMVPLSRMVANELSRQGNTDAARRILSDLSFELTAAGQFNQAAKLLRNSDPQTALRAIEKTLDAVNTEYENAHMKSDWRAELTEAEREEILSTDFTNEDAYPDLYERITKRIGAEMPSTVFEKLTELRRINMLLRPRTMIKNIASNVPMVGLRKGAETLSIGIQKALSATGFMDEAERTRGWASKEQRQLAREYYDANKADINGQSNKWDFRSMLKENRTIFKGGAVEKALSKMTGKEVESFGEALRHVTYDLLEKGDAPFVKSAFVDSLSQYCAAKGITSADGITPAAVEFATANAMEATFKNANIIADLVNQAKRNSSPAVAAAIDVIIPFTTTPANILSLMGDYSPIGFGKMLAKDGAAAKIDAFSKATVGSALMALGWALRGAGVITGGEDDDKDKAAYDKANGIGTYSIGGKVSYDWAQPVGSLLAFGAEIADATKGQESWSSALLNAVYTAGDSALNLSLFQNIMSILKGKGSSATQQLIDAVIEGSATQLVPGLAGDIAKLIDGTVRSTYTGGNTLDDSLAKVTAMIPGLSKKLPESVNVKGETNTRGSWHENVFNTLINPTNVTRGKKNAVDEEVYRLVDATGGKAFIPSVSPYKVEYENKEYTMNGKERETFQKVQGQTYYELAEPLLDSEMYKALSDDQKAAVLTSIRDYALDEAKRQFVDGKNDAEEYTSAWDKIQDLPDKSNYLAANQAFSSAKKSSATAETYNALDTALKYWGKLSKKSKETLLDKGDLHVSSLVYASKLGQSSDTWYSNKTAIDADAAKLGGSDAAKAISVYNNMRGKSNKEILTAMKSQLVPERGGKQNSTIRKVEAYMTAAEKNGYEANLGEWLNLVANVADADENGGSPNYANVADGWAALGLSDKDTYAGIDLTTAYNILKTGVKSYALSPEYAAQNDSIFAGILPEAEKSKAKLGGSVAGVGKPDPNSQSAYRALGLTS